MICLPTDYFLMAVFSFLNCIDSIFVILHMYIALVVIQGLKSAFTGLHVAFRMTAKLNTVWYFFPVMLVCTFCVGENS